jgi:hypothetical protein
MNRIAAMMMLCVLARTGVTSAQCDDLADANLCVYTLTSTDEAAFSAADGAVSSFWNAPAWTSRDQIMLVPPDNCMPGQCNFAGGASDASITIRAAATARGLYLYAAVQDNIWVDAAAADDLGADCVDLYFAQESAATSFSCPDCLIGLYESELTYTTQQFQVWMGGSAIPAALRFAHYDGSLWSWTTTNPTWAEARTARGIEVEVVQVDATHKVQEWFLPWETYGSGIAAGTDISGQRLGFSGGYNDKDGDNASADCLRWLGKDPWVGKGVTNYWGDLQLPADLGTVQSAMAARPRRVSSRAGIAESGVCGREYYSLTGRRLALGARQHAAGAGIVVERELTAGGATSARVLGSMR